MRVNDAMVERAGAYSIDALPQVALRWISRSFLRGLLETALDDVPDPYELTSDLVNADRIAALETKLAKVRALVDEGGSVRNDELRAILGEP